MTFNRVLAPAIFALMGHSIFAQSALAQDQPNPGDVYIKNIDAKGSGCNNPGSYSVNLSADRQAFTVSFSEFVAAIGQGLSPLEARKNCSLTMTLNIPAGFQYSIGTFNYRGYMDLDANIQADHTTSYFFQGTGETGKFVASARGPLSKDFVYTDKVGLTSVYIPDVWSPCNADRALTINPAISLRKLGGAASDAEGLITNDTVDGEINQVFGLKYRRCGQTQPNPGPGPGPILPPPPPPPSTALKPGAVYNLVSKHSGLCLDAVNHGAENGTKFQQWVCTGEEHQKFLLVAQPEGAYALQGVPSGRLVTVENWRQDNSAPIILLDNQNGANQKLRLEPSTNGSYVARFTHSQKCLDVSGPSTENGAIVHQWDCLNAANQQWEFREVAASQPPASDEVYTLSSRRSGKCLDVSGHSLDNGARLQQWACTGEAHQKFRLKKHNDGTATLVGVQSGKAVSVASTSYDNGAAVIQWDFNGSPDQFVRVVPSANGSSTVRFAHSGKCLDVSETSYLDGAIVHQWDCLGADNQDWYLNKQ